MPSEPGESSFFETIFDRDDIVRANFLSRLFGLFSEEIVRIWCAQPGATYEDLGRPTLTAPGEIRGYTLDFLLRNRGSGELFVAELKGEIAFENFRYMRLREVPQLRLGTRGPAFDMFMQCASDSASLSIRSHGAVIPDVTGAILIWGAITSEGRDAVMEDTGVADVLSLEAMIADLRVWKPVEWTALLAKRRRWTSGLFDDLEGRLSLPDHGS